MICGFWKWQHAEAGRRANTRQGGQSLPRRSNYCTGQSQVLFCFIFLIQLQLTYPSSSIMTQHLSRGIGYALLHHPTWAARHCLTLCLPSHCPAHLLSPSFKCPLLHLSKSFLHLKGHQFPWITKIRFLSLSLSRPPPPQRNVMYWNYYHS